MTADEILVSVQQLGLHRDEPLVRSCILRARYSNATAGEAVLAIIRALAEQKASLQRQLVDALQRMSQPAFIIEAREPAPLGLCDMVEFRCNELMILPSGMTYHISNPEVMLLPHGFDPEVARRIIESTGAPDDLIGEPDPCNYVNAKQAE